MLPAFLPVAAQDFPCEFPGCTTVWTHLRSFSSVCNNLAKTGTTEAKGCVSVGGASLGEAGCEGVAGEASVSTLRVAASTEVAYTCHII